MEWVNEGSCFETSWMVWGCVNTQLPSPATGRETEYLLTFLGIHQHAPQREHGSSEGLALWPVLKPPSKQRPADLLDRLRLPIPGVRFLPPPTLSPSFPCGYFLLSVSCMKILSWHQFSRGPDLVLCKKCKITLKSRCVLLSEWPSSSQKSLKER